MVSLKKMFKRKVKYTYVSCKSILIEESSESFEDLRKETFDKKLGKWQKHYENYTKNQMEVDRIKYQLKITELQKDIKETWGNAAYSLMMQIMIGDVLKYVIFLPTIILLLAGKTKISILVFAITVGLILSYSLPPIRDFITFIIFKQGLWMAKLTAQYEAYGSIEARITAADYRGISRLDKRPIIIPQKDDTNASP